MKVMLKFLLVFWGLPAFSQPYDITLENVSVNKSNIAHYTFQVTNSLNTDIYIHEDDLLSEYILFTEKETMKAARKILFMNDRPVPYNERFHFVKMGEKITLKLTMSFEAFDLDRNQQYKVIVRYDSLKKKKLKGALPMTGPFYTNPANVLFQ
jgi:hypothetical protein